MRSRTASRLGRRRELVLVEDGPDAAVGNQGGDRLVDGSAQEGLVGEHHSADAERGRRQGPRVDYMELGVGGIGLLLFPQTGGPNEGDADVAFEQRLQGKIVGAVGIRSPALASRLRR